MEYWNKIVPDCVTPEGVPTLSCAPAVLHYVIQGALMFAGIIALFMIIFAGIKMINSGGDTKNVESARKTLTFAIIGLVIVLLSFFIVNIFADITGAKCLKSFGTTGCDNSTVPGP